MHDAYLMLPLFGGGLSLLIVVLIRGILGRR